MEETITGEDLKNIPSEKKSEKQVKKDEEKLEIQNERLKARLYDLEFKNKKLEENLQEAKAEKRKPGIQRIDEEGTFKKNKWVNSSGLSDLVLPPYTKNQIATYRILGSDQINPATGLAVMPVDTLIPGEYLFHDIFDKDVLKRDKIRRNVVGTKTEMIDGKPRVIEKVEDIVFNRGWLHVPCASKYPLYVFMELHSMYSGNRWRPNNYPAVYERTDLKYHSPAAKAASLELSLDAGTAVRNMKKDDIIAYALSSKPPIPTVGREIHEIRTDLITRVMANPIPFFKQNKDEKAGILINVSDAIAFGLVEYQPDRKSFVLTEGDEILFTHTVQEEPTNAFVKFLSKDGNQEYYEAILNRLNYYGND